MPKKKDIAYNYKSMVEFTISASAMESDQKLEADAPGQLDTNIIS